MAHLETADLSMQDIHIQIPDISHKWLLHIIDPLFFLHQIHQVVQYSASPKRQKIMNDTYAIIKVCTIISSALGSS